MVLLILELTGCGFFGGDRLYVGGQWGLILGLVKLFTCGGCGIWAIMDFVAVALNAVLKKDSINFLLLQCNFSGNDLQAAFWLGIACFAVPLLCYCVCCFCP